MLYFCKFDLDSEFLGASWEISMLIASNFFFLKQNSIRWFTALLRTYKLATIILFQADASDKEEDPREPGQEGDDEDEGCTTQKCRVWFLLSQELTAIGCVAFLLLICLPVLAFWFMFIGIFVSTYNIYTLLRRLWREAHTNGGRVRAREEGNDVEFKEFLSNFSDTVDGIDGNW